MAEIFIKSIPFHVIVVLFRKFKLVLVAMDFCSTAYDNALVAIAVIATCDAVLVHLNVTIPLVGF